MRLDKWLWAARFFKTRARAVEAINGGRVHVNGARVRPARAIQVGDELDITRDTSRFHVTVNGLNNQRRPATEARLLYQESEQSIRAREEERELRRLNNASVHRPSRRPNKRERRQIDKWRGR